MRTSIALCLICLGTIYFCWRVVQEADKADRRTAEEIFESCPADTIALKIDTLGVILKILQGDKKACRLLDAWPEAPQTMLEAAEKYSIDPFLLPAISRAEGPTAAMLLCRGIYGLESHGKIIGWSSFDTATMAAAQLLAKLENRYLRSESIFIDSLALIWCPVNHKNWAKNVMDIYNAGLRIERD